VRRRRGTSTYVSGIRNRASRSKDDDEKKRAEIRIIKFTIAPWIQFQLKKLSSEYAWRSRGRVPIYAIPASSMQLQDIIVYFSIVERENM
jgi:hypothetical protein